MSDFFINTASESSPEATTDPAQQHLNELSNKTWKSVKITNSFGPNDTRHRIVFDEKAKYSNYQDILFSGKNGRLCFHRAILVSNSNHLLKREIFTKKDILAEINNLMKNDYSRLLNIRKIMYEKDGSVELVINENNFYVLFKDMHNLGMEMDLENFEQFIAKTSTSNIRSYFKAPYFRRRLFHLYEIILNSDHEYDYLFPTITEYFSKNLCGITFKKEFLALSAQAFVQILLSTNRHWIHKFYIGKICAKWICHDFQNRRHYLKDLVNVAKYRYSIFPYWDWDVDFGEHLRKKHNNNTRPREQERELEKYFNGLFYYSTSAKFDTLPPKLENMDELDYQLSRVRVVRPINHRAAWTSFLEKGLFCDVSINVQGTIFELHRVKLISESTYFSNLFREPYMPYDEKVYNSESAMKQYSLDQIDPATFRKIIHYIYKEEIQVTSQTDLMNLARAAKFLEMNDFRVKCNSKMLEIIDRDPAHNVFEIFEYVWENVNDTSDFYKNVMSKILRSWSKLHKYPHFNDISLNVLSKIFALRGLTMNKPDEILDLSSKWICRDIEYRYEYTITEVARAINRNYRNDSNPLKLETPSNLTDCSEKYVKDRLVEILSSMELVRLNPDYVPDEANKPRFVVFDEERSVCIMDVNFKKLVQLTILLEGNFEFDGTGTIIGDQLFILYCCNGNSFTFTSYSLATKKTISLATDARMRGNRKFGIVTCNDQIYYYDGKNCLKYIVKLNRWIPSSSDEINSCDKYTTDGKKIYKILNGSLAKVTNESSKKNKRNGFGEIFRRLGKKCGLTTLMNKMNACLTKKEPNSRTFYAFKWITQTGISDSYANYGTFAGHAKCISLIYGANEIHTL